MKFTIDAAFLMLAAKSAQLFVWLEVGEPGVVVELRAGFVERRNPGVAAAGDVERAKIERQPEQIAADVGDDELVDGIADVARQSANDVGVDFFDGRAAANIGLRIEEHREQRLPDRHPH